MTTEQTGKFRLNLTPDEIVVYNSLRRLLGELYYSEIDKAFYFEKESLKQDLIGQARKRLELLVGS